MISARTIQDHWDFILNDILQERPQLLQFHRTNPDITWFLARAWSKSNGLTELPQSASNVRTTRELLEGDFFERNTREKSWTIVLVAQKRMPRTKFESSDKEEDEVPYFKQESRDNIKREPRDNIKREPRSNIKREPRSNIKREPRSNIKREPQIKKEKTVVRSQPDLPSNPYSQTPQEQSFREPRTNRPESQTPSHKRSRNDLSSSEELPADVLTWWIQNHGAVPTSTSTVRTLSDRTRTQSVHSSQSIHSSLRSPSMLAMSRTTTEPIFNPVQVSATPTTSPHRTKSQQIDTAEDPLETLSGRTRQQQKELEKVLSNQRQSKGKPSKANKGKKK